MALKKQDKEFRVAAVTHLEFKQVEMDRVLTGLFARLYHDGYTSRLRRTTEIKTEVIRAEILEKLGDFFKGFDGHEAVLDRWIETHLMDMVNRGRPNQAIAAPRPLHGFTYRFRNPKHSRDYGAAQQIFNMLYYAPGEAGSTALLRLKKFFFKGVDPSTGNLESGDQIDVETQALLRLSNQVQNDAPDTRRGRETAPPMFSGAASLFAEDIIRLLTYERFIPRSVMVEYIKILFAFHLALYLFKQIRILPEMVKQGGKKTYGAAREYCSPDADPIDRLGLVIDVGNLRGTHMATLAERSAEGFLAQVPAFIRSIFVTRKLDEFADHLKKKKSKIPNVDFDNLKLPDILQFRSDSYKEERESLFRSRIDRLVDESREGDEDLPTEIEDALAMDLDQFDTYIEILAAYRGKFHYGYFLQTLETLCLKNRPGALIAQARTRGAPRRFVLDSKLLEVLLQLAVLDTGGKSGFYTKRIRVEELLNFLRVRYGLHIDRLPDWGQFRQPSISDREALRENVTAFKDRLREIGFFNDLSDAYISQFVTPRYVIDRETAPQI